MVFTRDWRWKINRPVNRIMMQINLTALGMAVNRIEINRIVSKIIQKILCFFYVK